MRERLAQWIFREPDLDALARGWEVHRPSTFRRAYATRAGTASSPAPTARAAVIPTVRHGLVGVTRTVVTLHRVRAGLAQAGVGDRAGRPPWLPWAHPTGPKGLVVWVWLRAATTPGDLRAAVPVIAAACGPAVVEIEQHGRDDRVELPVVRPRWGWPA